MVMKNQESSSTRILAEDTPLSPTQIVRTVVDVDVKPNQMIQTNKVTKHYQNADGTTSAEVADKYEVITKNKLKNNNPTVDILQNLKKILS
jgi:hypothetical protein